MGSYFSKSSAVRAVSADPNSIPVEVRVPGEGFIPGRLHLTPKEMMFFSDDRKTRLSWKIQAMQIAKMTAHEGLPKFAPPTETVVFKNTVKDEVIKMRGVSLREKILIGLRNANENSPKLIRKTSQFIKNQRNRRRGSAELLRQGTVYINLDFTQHSPDVNRRSRPLLSRNPSPAQSRLVEGEDLSCQNAPGIRRAESDQPAEQLCASSSNHHLSAPYRPIACPIEEPVSPPHTEIDLVRTRALQIALGARRRPLISDV